MGYLFACLRGKSVETVETYLKTRHGQKLIDRGFAELHQRRCLVGDRLFAQSDRVIDKVRLNGWGAIFKPL
jgi:hypothetical protein